jgi:hypothetical protein
MKAGGLALQNQLQPTISLEMPVPSQGHCITNMECFANENENEKLGVMCTVFQVKRYTMERCCLHSGI